jgi:hypothetical protein
MTYDHDLRALLKAVKASSRSPAEAIRRVREKQPARFVPADQADGRPGPACVQGDAES